MDLHSWQIDYTALSVGALGAADADLADRLRSAWCEAYIRSVPHRTEICEFDQAGFTHLFDDPSWIRKQKRVDDARFVCERLVAAYGLSRPQSGAARSRSRMRGFPRGAAEAVDVVRDSSFDRGHFLSHAAGGGLDANLFPQLREVNRGWSARGRAFRQMERAVANAPGAFCFARPIYSGPTDFPFEVELGLRLNDDSLLVEAFPNCRSEQQMREIETAILRRMAAD